MELPRESEANLSPFLRTVVELTDSDVAAGAATQNAEKRKAAAAAKGREKEEIRVVMVVPGWRFLCPVGVSWASSAGLGLSRGGSRWPPSSSSTRRMEEWKTSTAEAEAKTTKRCLLFRSLAQTEFFWNVPIALFFCAASPSVVQSLQCSRL